MIALLLAAATLGCIATDGDTIRCDGKPIRLSGIDSPEMPGHCRTGRVCAPGDPVAAKANMAKLVTRHRVTIKPIKKDLYARTVARVYVGKVNLSCAQLKGGFAIYKPQWDTGKAIAKECGL